jgi:hypothetical protein
VFSVSNIYLHQIAKALLDLVKFGIPITFSVDTSNSLISIKGKRGLLVLSVSPLLDPITKSVRSIGVAEVGSSHYTPIGFIEGGSGQDVITVDSVELVKVLANGVLGIYEADLWVLRLTNRSRLRTPNDIPRWFTHISEKGLNIMELAETCDYAIGVNDVIGVWVNMCTGRVDLALEEQERMNVMKWGSLKDLLINWVKQLESV